MARLGFVGLGVMGGGITKRLLAAGHDVVGYNRTREKAQWLVELGLRLADTPREVAEHADVVFSMVTNTKALEAVTDGPDGILAGLGPGKVYVDMSTVSPAASRELAERVAKTGAAMLDAPCSGSSVTIEEGKLSIMVGGDEETFRRVEPVLKQMGPRVTHVGGNGQAVTLKIATNLQLAVQMLAFSEGVVLAEKAGIAREVAVDFMANSVVGSPMIKYRAGYLLDQIEEIMFDVGMMQKDMLLALEAGRQHSVPLPTTAVTNEWLTAAKGLGLGKRDFAVVYEVLAHLAGR